MQRTTEKHQIKKTGKTGKITYGDRERIGQVITNFLTNAIKYSQDAKEVIVTSSTRQGSIRFSVQDFGIGIPQDKLPLVFERFYRVSDSSHDTVPGIGLGLFISKEIITRQKGTIWAESTLGKGSIFYFRLPIRNKRSTKRS